jgi:hypothetical protein
MSWGLYYKTLQFRNAQHNLQCYYLDIVGIARYHEGKKKHLDDPVPDGDFLVLHCLGIGLSVLDIKSYCIGKYMCKI